MELIKNNVPMVTLTCKSLGDRQFPESQVAKLLALQTKIKANPDDCWTVKTPASAQAAPAAQPGAAPAATPAPAPVVAPPAQIPEPEDETNGSTNTGPISDSK